MNDTVFLSTIFNSAAFCLFNSFCNIHCHRTQFRVRHKTFRTKHFTKLPNQRHHVGGRNHAVELEPAVLDLLGQFFPPHVYLVLFLVALPGQYLFGVTSMTVSAVVATYAFGLLYSTATGIYFFYDSYVPIAVFLGMHLLFTDPSTAPRTEVGRIMFGVLYGLSTVGLYVLLGRAGVPTFYDKLLQVPVLNLSIQLLDRVAPSRRLRKIDPVALGRGLLVQPIGDLAAAKAGRHEIICKGHPEICLILAAGRIEPGMPLATELSGAGIFRL